MVVKTATAIAVLWFNKENTSFECALEELGMILFEGLLTLGDSRDDRRIRKMCTRLAAEARAHHRSMVKKAHLEDYPQEPQRNYVWRGKVLVTLDDCTFSRNGLGPIIKVDGIMNG